MLSAALRLQVLSPQGDHGDNVLGGSTMRVSRMERDNVGQDTEGHWECWWGGLQGGPHGVGLRTEEPG